MKKNLIHLVLILVLAVIYRGQPSIAAEPAPQQKPAAIELAPSGFTGKVVETIEASRYTYVHVDTGRGKIWAATPDFQGKVGDVVTIPSQGLPMKNFHSNTLDRKFELVYFVASIAAEEHEEGVSKGSLIPGHPPVAKRRTTSQTEVGEVEKAKNGKTVAEVYAASKDLAGKEVLVRGRVVKFFPKIMGKNWLHLQDGSGSEGTNDLTVTTNTMVEVGDTVLVSGVVSVNRDFGHGYRFAVMLEDAAVTVE